jgi:hypothetical protein
MTMRLAMLAAVLGLMLAAPATAEARGWHGGGRIGLGVHGGYYYPRTHFYPYPRYYGPRVNVYAPIGPRVFIPGYWGWGVSGYYWNEGSWAVPPQPGMVWVPPGWNWDAGRQQWFWRNGYWTY